jgi:hypothetical protein
MNPITQLANDTGSGAITEAGNIMAGPIGYVVYFTVGLSLLGAVIFAIKKWF